METRLAPEVTFKAVDEQLGHLGYLVIDSTIRGRSAGGIRMQPNTTLKELTYLAKTMTLKFGLLGIPFGGAKAGIVANPLLPREKKLEIFRAFGRSLSPFLNKSYLPGSDMGTNDDDVIYIMKAANLAVKTVGPRTSSDVYTSWTALASVKAAADTLGLELSNCTVAIQGFGKVGSSIAKAISQTGANIVAVSTREGAIYNQRGLDPEKLLKLKDEAGDNLVSVYEKATAIANENLLSLDVDILFPCAGSWSINQSNVETIKSKIICPGANIPLTQDAEETLFRKGTLCLPDFVTNCGGVLGGYLRSFMSEKNIRDVVDGQFAEMVADILERSRSESRSPRKTAQKMSERRFLETKLRFEQKNVKNELFRIGSKVLSRKLIPKPILRFFSPVRVAFQFGKREFIGETSDEERA